MGPTCSSSWVSSLQNLRLLSLPHHVTQFLLILSFAPLPPPYIWLVVFLWRIQTGTQLQLQLSFLVSCFSRQLWENSVYSTFIVTLASSKLPWYAQVLFPNSREHTSGSLHRIPRLGFRDKLSLLNTSLGAKKHGALQQLSPKTSSS